MRSLAGSKLVIASHNKGKIKEIHELLSPYGVDVVGGPEFNLAEPEETEDSFIGNAQIKSRYFAQHTGLVSMSDDSGLVVPALDGAPGIYSARWAGENKDFNFAMKRVEEELIAKTGKAEGHDAHFVCALSIAWPDGYEDHVEGKVFGKLTFPPRGPNGFGYDAIFIPEGYTQTFGEMDPQKKHQMSHRANAFKQLVERCFPSQQAAKC